MGSRKTLLLGFLMLFSASYLDNVRGPLIPVLSQQFQMSYGTTTWFLVLGNLGAVIALLGTVPLLQFFSVPSLSRTVCLCFFGLAGFLFFVKGLFSLLVFATLLGALFPVFGALANLFVYEGTTTENRSKWLCALHIVYGGASLLAPIFTSSLIEKNFPWFYPFLACLPVTCLTLLLLGGKVRAAGASPVEKPVLRLNGEQLFAVLIFCFYVAGEVMISVWMTAYLVKIRHYSLSESAPYLSGFFVMMALTRAVCFFSLKKKTEIRVLYGCLILSCAFFLLGHFGHPAGFFLAGVLGPFFPIFLSLCSQRFADISQSFTLWLLAGTQLSIGIVNLMVGQASDAIGLEIAYQVPVVLLGMTLILMGSFFKQGKV